MAVQKLAGLEPDAFWQRHQFTSLLVKLSQLITKLDQVLMTVEQLRHVEVLVIESFNADKDFN